MPELDFGVACRFSVLDTRREPDKQVYELVIAASNDEVIFCKLPEKWATPKDDDDLDKKIKQLEILMRRPRDDESTRIMSREIEAYMTNLDHCGCIIRTVPKKNTR